MSLEGTQESREAEAFHTVVQRVRERKGREEMGEDERRRGQKTEEKRGERERRGELGTHEDLLGSPVPSLQAETSKHLIFMDSMRGCLLGGYGNRSCG